MILATRHIGIVGQDLEKRMHFWRDLMDLKVAIDFWQAVVINLKKQPGGETWECFPATWPW
jgi:hypothetical protein